MRPPNAADYNPDAQNFTPKLCAARYTVWSIAYNTELVKDPPKTLDRTDQAGI